MFLLFQVQREQHRSSGPLQVRLTCSKKLLTLHAKTITTFYRFMCLFPLNINVLNQSDDAHFLLAALWSLSQCFRAGTYVII